MKKNLEIITLIYKSIPYLDFIVQELKADYCKVPGWDISYKVIANDATPEILEYLKTNNINHYVFNNQDPDEYFINRVYRAYNTAVRESSADNVCLVNSDDVFSEGWLENLLKYHDGNNIPSSRLIESGKMPSGLYGLGLNFGNSPKTMQYENWYAYSKNMIDLHSGTIKPGGLYMPVVFERQRFLEAGGYPEGNIYDNGIGNMGNFIKAGDDYFFTDILEKKFNMRHITVFDSMVYHLQAGERDE